MFKEADILGYKVLDEAAARVASQVCDDLDGQGCHSFVFLNPHSIVMAQNDPTLRSAILSCSGAFCDGVGLAIASRILNHERIHRVYGYEFFTALSSELSRRRRGRVFFLGGTDESVEQIKAKYAVEFPGVQLADSYAPPYQSEFTDDEIADMALRITASHTEVLWVGLGSPKQEKILPRLLQHCDVRCAAAVGAVFDFYTDRVPHAPALLRRMGLQWAHRLALEPSRLWRRTFVSGPLFLSYVMRETYSRRW